MARKQLHHPTISSSDSEIANYLDPLAQMAPARNGVTKRELECSDYRREADERLTEAGHNLIQWLRLSDDSTLWERWQGLSAAERECIARAGSLRATEATITRRVREYDKKVEAERKRKLRKVAWPSISRSAFDNLDRDPGDARGVVVEGRTR
jgi:hypothetical protein